MRQGCESSPASPDEARIRFFLPLWETLRMGDFASPPLPLEIPTRPEEGRVTGSRGTVCAQKVLRPPKTTRLP